MHPRFRATITAVAGVVLCVALAPAASAHTPQDVGPFVIETGWLNEPSFVGQPNAVQLIILTKSGDPVTDLGPDDLSVVVSIAGQETAPLSLTPAFDEEEGEGTPGEYRAALVPTAPGDYTFHFEGTVRQSPIDVSVTSSESTFDPVVEADELEFPVKQPTLTEVGTRLDRIDGRIEALQSAGPGSDALAAANSASAAAQSASAAADRALLIGVSIGGAGLLAGIAALVVAMRSRKAASPS